MNVEKERTISILSIYMFKTKFDINAGFRQKLITKCEAKPLEQENSKTAVKIPQTKILTYYMFHYNLIFFP